MGFLICSSDNRPNVAQETILIDRPLKLVGQQLPNLRGQLRRSVTLQSRQHMAVLCNAQYACSFATSVGSLIWGSLPALHTPTPGVWLITTPCCCRACLEAVTIRTLSGSDNRSIVAFGPQCSCICLNDCDLAGSSGLLIPQSKGTLRRQCDVAADVADTDLSLGRVCLEASERTAEGILFVSAGPDTRLVLKHCSIHSVHHPVPAISINIGDFLAVAVCRSVLVWLRPQPSSEYTCRVSCLLAGCATLVGCTIYRNDMAIGESALGVLFGSCATLNAT